MAMEHGIIAVKLNGGRVVTGTLRGFDPFMNLVVDEAIEECKTGEKNSIGMVVSSVVTHCDTRLMCVCTCPGHETY